jgi:uncharacterized membrane protein YagU involved in acid resistance
MTTDAAVRAPSPRHAILVGAILLAAALDLTFAFVFYGFQGATPSRILRGIAAGLIGREQALAAGSWVVVLGAALHFLMAGCAAYVFYLATRRWPVLARRWAFGGTAFGVAMYLVMHFIVIPLSRLTFHLPSLSNVAGELFSHIFLFGIVIAYGVARANRRIPA